MRVDGSVGGLGGCPFAPGASGNLALEDLAHALDAMGVDTGVDVLGLIEAARLACALAGRPVSSHVGVAGPRFRRARRSPTADGGDAGGEAQASTGVRAVAGACLTSLSSSVFVQHANSRRVPLGSVKYIERMNTSPSSVAAS